jgi:putative spermidine/putrescine transport system substrate-binding protein
MRAAVVAVTAGLALTACGGSSGGSGSASSGGSADAATATSAKALGGMDALVTAAKKEGTLNVIALPPDWANYGAMLKAFTDKYGIKINSALPDGSSADEINAVTSQKGQDRAPDVLDVGASFALQAAAQNLTRRATGTTTTAASSRSAATPRR